MLKQDKIILPWGSERSVCVRGEFWYALVVSPLGLAIRNGGPNRDTHEIIILSHSSTNMGSFIPLDLAPGIFDFKKYHDTNRALCHRVSEVGC